MADVIVSGHTHRAFYVPTERVFVNLLNKVTRHRVYNLSVGGYKDEYNLDSVSWERTKEFSPVIAGAWWLRFTWDDDRLQLNVHEALA